MMHALLSHILSILNQIGCCIPVVYAECMKMIGKENDLAKINPYFMLSFLCVLLFCDMTVNRLHLYKYVSDQLILVTPKAASDLFAGEVMMSFNHVMIPTQGNWFQTR